MPAAASASGTRLFSAAVAFIAVFPCLAASGAGQASGIVGSGIIINIFPAVTAVGCTVNASGTEAFRAFDLPGIVRITVAEAVRITVGRAAGGASIGRAVVIRRAAGGASIRRRTAGRNGKTCRTFLTGQHIHVRTDIQADNMNSAFIIIVLNYHMCRIDLVGISADS